MLTDLIPYIDEILIYVSIASIIVVFALPWRIKAKGQLGKTVKNPEAFELHITLYKGLMGVCLFAQSGRIQAHFLAFSFICKRFSIAVYPNPFSKQLDYSPNNNSLRKKNEYDQYDDNQQSDDHTIANQSKKKKHKIK